MSQAQARNPSNQEIVQNYSSEPDEVNQDEQHFDDSGSDNQNENDDEFDDYGTEVVHDNLNLGASMQPIANNQGMNMNTNNN